MDTNTVNSTISSTIERLNQPGTVVQANPASTLDQTDFLRLLTVQLQQQDPLEPVQNEEMLAQMAQFSALANTTATNDTLEEIVARLDALIAVQSPTQPSTTPVTQASN